MGAPALGVIQKTACMLLERISPKKYPIIYRKQGSFDGYHSLHDKIKPNQTWRESDMDRHDCDLLIVLIDV